jgi:hypothetical protein
MDPRAVSHGVKIKKQGKYAPLGANPEVKKSKILLESIGYGGESVSQPPLKDNAFSTFLG